MKSSEFDRIYHPKFGKFVYKHMGSGLIVDNILKPNEMLVDNILKPVVEKAAEKLGKKVVEKTAEKLGKKVVEKALKSEIKSDGDKLGKKVVGKGHIIIEQLDKEMKKLDAMVPQKQENYKVLLKRMISGEGYEKPKKQKK